MIPAGIQSIRVQIFRPTASKEKVEVNEVKFGMRKPSLKKSIKARTTGKIKRKAKSAINPMYGKKGTGWVRNPKKAAYNKVYRKTSFSLFDLLKKIFK